ncbi:hypothetical protein K493DRAFT_314373 [Basidiobolus meristosporus CBS 931.73]|uniref:Coilin tudor domain-containing protein n=1 Tax=Basidiobolus meristosporus CBS 931.73 TaxID=1314790 RepID=A0A1Y1YFH7_9FUNG|nr:hypothetical protein K493DRAFT_314373 [Basidiobolus meristosporus CBS 931.73]|eukprot:ORX96737.1 hypothetical protein K493DRAFT_314373 [Basidiobolus meristosporus CBS 931.73]
MRVRLSFDPSLLALRCWYEIPAENSQNPFRPARIQELLSLLVTDFELQHEPQSLLLEIDGYELLPSGSVNGLIKENDLLCVRSRDLNSSVVPLKRDLAPVDKLASPVGKKSPKSKTSTTSPSCKDAKAKRKSEDTVKSEKSSKSESRKRRKVEELPKSPKKKEKKIKKVLEKVKDKIKKVKSNSKDDKPKGTESKAVEKPIASADFPFKPEIGILEPPVRRWIQSPISTLNILSAPVSDSVLSDGMTLTQSRNARKRKKRQMRSLERNMMKQDPNRASETAPLDEPPEFYANPSASLVKNKKKGFLKEMLNTSRQHFRFEQPVEVEMEAGAGAESGDIAQYVDSGVTATPQNDSSQPVVLSPPRVYHSTVELGFNGNQSSRKNRKKTPRTPLQREPSSQESPLKKEPSSQETPPCASPVVAVLPDNGPRNYSIMEPLLSPRAGDLIAYKILEMTASYTPEISDYKEATVLSFDHSSNSITLKLTPDALQVNQGEWDGISARKFELQPESDDEYIVEGQQALEEVTLDFGLLIDPRKIPQSMR